jgi:hypothetical protein
MRVRVRDVQYGALASPADDPGQVVHGSSFDEAVIALAAKHAALCPDDGSLPQMADLTVTVISQDYGQFLLDVTRHS